MGTYVLLTASLVLRGSPESKPVDQDDREGAFPEEGTGKSPAWSRRTGPAQLFYPPEPAPNCHTGQ